jgi:hypothetical protein
MSERASSFYLNDMIGFAENVVTYCEGLDLKKLEQTGLNYDASVRYREMKRIPTLFNKHRCYCYPCKINMLIYSFSATAE